MLRRWAKRAAIALSAGLTAVTLLLGLVALRLSWGPISLDSLTTRLEAEINRALSEAAPGWRASLGGTRLSAGEAGFSGAGLRLINLTLRDPAGARVFGAGALSIKLDALQALAGRVAIAAIGIEGSRVQVARNEAGGWRFALDSAGKPGADAAAPAGVAEPPSQALIPAPPEGAPGLNDESALLAKVIDAWSNASEQEGAFGALRQISVRDAEMTVRDAVTGAVWSAPTTRFDFRRPEEGGLRATLEAEVVFSDGPGRPARLSVLAERPLGARTARLSARFENAPAGALATEIAGGRPPFIVAGLLSGEADVALDLETGLLVSVSAAVRGEGARLAARRLGAAAGSAPTARRYMDPLAHSAFEAAFDFDPASQELRLSRLRVAGDRLRAEVDGRARLLFEEQALSGVEGALSVRSATVLDPGLFSEPLEIRSGGFSFDLSGLAGDDDAPPKLVLGDLSLRTPDVAATGSATALLAPPEDGSGESLGAVLGARMDVDLTLSDFPAERLAALWPLPAAPGGREWVASNILGGTLSGGRLKARLGGGVAPLADGAAAAETVDFDFSFRDLESLYLGAMTPITGGFGAGEVTAEGFTLTVERAEVDLGEAGAVRLDGSRFEIPTFEPEIPPAKIRIASSGPARAVLALIDQPPLALPRKLGLDPATVSGTHSGVTELAFPLAKDLPIDDIAISSKATFGKLALPVAAVGGRRATAPKAQLAVTQKDLRLDASGARLDGYDDIPMRVTWREIFAPTARQARSRLDLSASVSAAQLRDRFGAPEAAGLGGKAAIAARVTAQDGAAVRLDVTATLDDLAIAPEHANWRKSAGAPGVAEARALYQRGGWTLSRLSASAPGLSLSGKARLAEDGALRELQLGSLRLGEDTDLSVDMTRGEDDALSIEARGASLDLRGLFGAAAAAKRAEAAQAAGAAKSGAAGAAGTGAAEKRPRFNLDLRVDRVLVSDQGVFREATIVAARNDQSGLYGDLDARVKEGVMRGSIRPSPQGARYRLEITDAGAALTAFGLVERAERGTAKIEAKERADGAIVGLLTAENVVIKDAPALADILSVASVVGIIDLASSGGISFTSIEAPFVLDERRLTVKEAIVSGPSLGMAVSGYLDREKGVLDVDGTLSPAFVLNGLPGRLPVIGDLLTGGEGDGVISVAFDVNGPLSDPKVSVQPLSVLAPGPLKRLFGQ